MSNKDGVSKAEALKNLAVALGCAATADAVTGDTIAEIIQFMADTYTGGSGS